MLTPSCQRFCVRLGSLCCAGRGSGARRDSADDEDDLETTRTVNVIANARRRRRGGGGGDYDDEEEDEDEERFSDDGCEVTAAPTNGRENGLGSSTTPATTVTTLCVGSPSSAQEPLRNGCAAREGGRSRHTNCVTFSSSVEEKTVVVEMNGAAREASDLDKQNGKVEETVEVEAADRSTLAKKASSPPPNSPPSSPLSDAKLKEDAEA